MYGSWLYVVTPDNYVVSLESSTGKERWAHKLTTEGVANWSTSAPIVVRKHVLVGIGGDSPSGPTRGFLESVNAETGESEWRWYTTPGPGEPGIETWPNPEASLRSSGAPWQPPTFDPDLEPAIRPNRPSDAHLQRQEPRGRQSLHLFHRRTRRRHREDEVVYRNVAARHARLGCDRGHDPGGRHDQRAAAQAACADESQRLLLSPRSHQWQSDRGEAVHALELLPPLVRDGILTPNPAKEGSPSGTLSSRRRTARSISRRRRSVQTPAWSTSTPPMPGASSTSLPIRPIQPGSGEGRNGTASSSNRA